MLDYLVRALTLCILAVAGSTPYSARKGTAALPSMPSRQPELA